MRAFLALSQIALALSLCAACSSTPSGTNTTGSGGSGGGAGGGGGNGGGGTLTPICTEPTTPIPCEDQVIQNMNLLNNIAVGAITTEADGTGFKSTIDARGGGFNPTESYVYAKFTDTGLEKVDMTDEDSLTSMNWDIAFRRFIIRLNSGNSGPSCVSVARMKDGTVYEETTALPDTAILLEDEYFTADSCTLIPEPSGLGSAATAMHSFWEYPGSCVKMTGNVYILQKADGRLVKLTVTNYYDPTVQEQCDTTGSVPMSGSGSGTVGMRWAILP